MALAAAVAMPTRVEDGSVLDYVEVAKLGSGAYGVVIAGRHRLGPESNRQEGAEQGGPHAACAVKFVPVTSNEDAAKQLREVVTMQKLVEAGDASNVAILKSARCHCDCKTELDAFTGVD